MSDRRRIRGDTYPRLINRAIRRHEKYREGMMVELVPRDVRSEGYSIVCKVPDVFEVVRDAVAEVDAEFFPLSDVAHGR